MEEIQVISDVIPKISIFSTVITTTVTKSDLEKVEKEAKEYTDSRLVDHEKLHKSIDSNFNDMKEDNKRIEGKVDKILFLLAKR
jgi:hypothetical protein